MPQENTYNMKVTWTLEVILAINLRKIFCNKINRGFTKVLKKVFQVFFSFEPGNAEGVGDETSAQTYCERTRKSVIVGSFDLLKSEFNFRSR